jgi:cyclophilin family peptidyl-prolyl cis-trans isomerase
MTGPYHAPPEMRIDPDGAYSATLHTSHGDIDVELLPRRAPLAVNNFVFLSQQGFYDGVLFHRVIPGFMIQGGDPTGTGRGGPGYRFRDELEGDGDYARGTVAMANAGPDTNGSQFFICHGSPRLPHAYTIFGRVTRGMDAVDAIAALPTDHSDKPREEAVIRRIAVSEE